MRKLLLILILIASPMFAGELTEGPFLISSIIAADANAVLTGAGYVHGLTIVVAGASTPEVKIYDALTVTGTAKFQMLTPTIGYYPLGFTVSTGITVEINGGTAPQCYVHYKRAS